VNSLVISTAVWVVNRIHSHTRNVRIELTSGLGLVVGCTGRTQWHLISAMAGENTDGCSAGCWKFLQGARGHPNTHHVSDTGFNGAGVPSRSGHFTTVSRAKLEVVDGRTFRDVAQMSDVSRAESNVVADGHFATDGDAFRGSDQGGVSVGGLDASEWSAVNRTVNQFCDFTHHVFVAWHAVLTWEAVASHAVAW
jgi:hypothetical protein